MHVDSRHFWFSNSFCKTPQKLFFTTLLLVSSHLHAQFKGVLLISNNDTISGQFADSVGFRRFVLDTMEFLQNTNFPLSTFDSFQVQGDSGRAKLWLGPLIDNVFVENWEEIGAPDSVYSWVDYFDLLLEIENSLIDQGRGLYQIKPKIKSWEESRLNILFSIDSGMNLFLDSLKISGIKQTKYSFLKDYLGFRSNDVYQQGLLTSITGKINKLEFLELLSPPIPTINMFGDVSILLDLREKRGLNHIDGLIGLNSGNQNDGSLIQGQIDLTLENLFGRGRTLDFNWNSRGNQSQNLDLGYQHPFFFKSPIDLGYRLSMNKQDTTFFRFLNAITLTWNSSKRLDYSLKWKKESSSLLNGKPSDTTLSRYDLTLYGVGIASKSGWGKWKQKSRSHFLIGERRLEEKRNVQTELDFKSDWTYRLRPLLDLNLTIMGYKMWFKDVIRNNLFRIGGFNSLRGFFEQEFFISDILMLSPQIDLTFDQQSKVFAFWDFSIIRDYSDRTIPSLIRFPMGVGCGLKLQTNSGIINLTYALGKYSGEPFSFENSKIHFGYQAQF